MVVKVVKRKKVIKVAWKIALISKSGQLGITLRLRHQGVPPRGASFEAHHSSYSSAAIQGHDNAQHKAKTWKLRDIRMCRNLFLKRTSRSKQHSFSNEAFSLNNSSESESCLRIQTHFEITRNDWKKAKGDFCGSFVAQRRLKKRTIVWLFCMLYCFSLSNFLSLK